MSSPPRGCRELARCCRRAGLFEAIIIALCLLAPRAQAGDSADPRALLDRLNKVSLDPTQVYTLRDAHLTRDRIKLFFDRGYIGFFTEVDGEITGAVYAGSGEILLIPPSDVEKRNLAQFTQAPILEEPFNSVYMRFTDRTARELLAVAHRPDPDDPEKPADFVGDWEPAVRGLRVAASPRILMDLLSDRRHPFFHAQISGNNLGVFEVNDDERAPEAITAGAAGRNGDLIYSNLWCSFPSKTSEAHLDELLQGAVRVRSYKLDTRINEDNSLEGRAELELESLSSSDRVLTFELSRWLKVSTVKDEQGHKLAVFQNPSDEDSEAATRSNDWIEVVLPAPHAVGEKFGLSFTYFGNVIANVGNGVLYVGARGSWYPNCGASVPADFDLTFHYPEGLELAATGSRVEETKSAGWKQSRWRCRGVYRVAGFNLGSYYSVERQVGKTRVQVLATSGAESALEKRHVAAQPLQPLVPPPLRHDPNAPVEVLRAAPPPLTPRASLESVADNAAGSVEYFEEVFGPFPYPELAISQAPGSFGQGWPGLVYLPTLSFLPKIERSQMGLGGGTYDFFNRCVLAHEVAHQWWGNLVGWKTYHDQWLSEGIASYAGALYLSREKDGERQFHELLRAHKHDLLSKNKAGDTVESDGPIWLGWRLSNSLHPDGYNTIVYKKACWVFHMLRDVLAGPGTDSDTRFLEMLRDFIATYRGQQVSTEDFIRHAEKYMPRDSDLDHNHRLDWFFNEWVYGTGIPTYEIESSVRRLGPQKYLIQGKIEQSGVESTFEMLVPVVATMGRGKKVRLGRIAVGEGGGKFRFTTYEKPAHVTIDADNLLAVVR
jgi:hypothetical protein